MNMFEQRLNEFNESFEETVVEVEELSLADFLRYELIYSWEKRIFEDDEKLQELGLI